MEKLLQDVGKDILPGVSYIDHFEKLIFPACNSCLNANVEAIVCYKYSLVFVLCIHIILLQFCMLMILHVLKYNFYLLMKFPVRIFSFVSNNCLWRII